MPFSRMCVKISAGYKCVQAITSVRCSARYFCMYGAILPLMWYTGERPGSLRYALPRS